MPGAQFGLFGDPSPAPVPLQAPEAPEPGRRCALFFALQPEPVDAQRLAAQSATLQADHVVGYRVAPERLHVSLHGLGEHAEPPLQRIDQALRAGAALRMPPVALAFDRVQSFGGVEQRPVVLDHAVASAPLRELYQRLGMALADAGLPVPQRSFTPHMTLWWSPQPVAPTAVQPVHWTSRRLRLIWSHVGRKRYQLLGDWPLAETR